MTVAPKSDANIAASTVSPAPALSVELAAKYDKCRKLAASVDHIDEGSRKALQRALVELYDFGQTLRKSPPDLEAFVIGEGKAWNKTTRDNPYNALTQIVFPRRAKGRLSTYARALKQAHILSYDQKTLQKELGTEGVGLERLAGTVAKIESDIRSAPLEAALPVTIAMLAKRPDLRDAPEFKTINGFAEVLVHVDPSGQFKIVDIIDATERGMKARLLRYAQPDRGRFGHLRTALNFARLVPSKGEDARVISIKSEGGRVEVHAQGADGTLMVAHLPAIVDFPECGWMHFVADKAGAAKYGDLTALINDADDDVVIVAKEVNFDGGRTGIELTFNGSNYQRLVTTGPSEDLGKSRMALKPDRGLGIVFAADIGRTDRQHWIDLDSKLQTSGRKVKLADGKRLSEKRNPRVEFAENGGQVEIVFSTASGTVAACSTDIPTISTSADLSLTFAASTFVKALKLFDRLAGTGDVHIRGSSAFVELKAMSDELDVSLVLANPIELQRDTTPFTMLSPSSSADEAQQLEAAE